MRAGGLCAAGVRLAGSKAQSVHPCRDTVSKLSEIPNSKHSQSRHQAIAHRDTKRVADVNWGESLDVDGSGGAGGAGGAYGATLWRTDAESQQLEAQAPLSSPASGGSGGGQRINAALWRQGGVAATVEDRRLRCWQIGEAEAQVRSQGASRPRTRADSRPTLLYHLLNQLPGGLAWCLQC